MGSDQIIAESSSTSSILRLFYLVSKVVKIYIQTVIDIFKTEKKKDINGQNILITGSGHGLGRELALKFAQHRVNLVLVDINEANNDLVKEELRKLDHYADGSCKILTYCVDIRSEDQVGDLAKLVNQSLGPVDILVNNAGIVQCLPFLELDPKLVERTFQINTMAHIWTIKHFLPNMLKKNHGHIVAIASIAGLIGNKYLTDYCASKFAIVGFMEALDNELHDKGKNEGIHLTTICPASMSTGMFKTLTTRFKWILPVLRADQVASEIINAILLNKSLVVIPKIALIMQRISFYVPRRVKQVVTEYLDYGVRPHVN